MTLHIFINFFINSYQYISSDFCLIFFLIKKNNNIGSLVRIELSSTMDQADIYTIGLLRGPG